MLLGLYLMLIDLAPRVAGRVFSFIWAVIMTVTTASFAWTAFGPDEPAIEGGVTGTAVEGRIVFGLVVVLLLGPLAVFLWRRAFRELFGATHTK